MKDTSESKKATYIVGLVTDKKTVKQAITQFKRQIKNKPELKALERFNPVFPVLVVVGKKGLAKQIRAIPGVDYVETIKEVVTRTE